MRTWAPPGGHLEFGEDLLSCAQRELYEETGLNPIHLEQFTVTNDIFHQEQKHYITIFYSGMVCDALPYVKEPEKCEQWQWFLLNALPENIFLSLSNLLQNDKLKQELHHTLKQNIPLKNVV